MISLKLVIYIALVGVTIIKADPVPYKDCGSDSSVRVNQFDISNCPSLPCPFKKNQTITMQFNFTTSYTLTAITNNLYGIIAGGKNFNLFDFIFTISLPNITLSTLPN